MNLTLHRRIFFITKNWTLHNRISQIETEKKNVNPEHNWRILNRINLTWTDRQMLRGMHKIWSYLIVLTNLQLFHCYVFGQARHCLNRHWKKQEHIEGWSKGICKTWIYQTNEITKSLIWWSNLKIATVCAQNLTEHVI